MSEEERQRIGAQLAARRKELGWKVRDIAARTGRQPSRVSEMETGRANSTVDALVQVGEVMGLRLLFVSDDRLDKVMAVLGQPIPARPHATIARNIFDELFIPDPEDGDEETDH